MTSDPIDVTVLRILRHHKRGPTVPMPLTGNPSSVDERALAEPGPAGGRGWTSRNTPSFPVLDTARNGLLNVAGMDTLIDLPPRAVPHPMLVPAPVEGREGRASSGTRATA